MQCSTILSWRCSQTVLIEFSRNTQVGDVGPSVDLWLLFKIYWKQLPAEFL